VIKRLSQDIIIYGVTNALRSLVPFLMLPILTAYLSTDDFGVLSLIEVSILLLFPLVSLNVYTGVNVEYFHLTKGQLGSYITNALLLAFASLSVWLVMALLFTDSLMSWLHLSSGLIVLLPIFAFLRLFPQLLLGILQVEQKAKHYLTVTLVQTLIDFALSYVLVVVYLKGYIGRLEGMYVSILVLCLFTLYYLYKEDLLASPTLRYSKQILDFSLPLIPHVLGGVIIAMSDRYFISYYAGNESLALYTVAYQVSALMLLFGTSINQAWNPFLFRLLKKENQVKVSVKYSLGLLLLFLGVGTLLYVMKSLLFFIFVDADYYGAKVYFPWLLLGFMFQSFYFLVTNYLFFKKHTKVLASITALGAVLNLILNYYFMQWYGVMGVAYATTLTWGIFFIVVGIVTIKLYRQKARL